MEHLEKLKLKKRILTSAISLSTLLSVTPISTLNVYANEEVSKVTEYNSIDENIIVDIYYYSIVYNLNKDVVLNIIKNMTANFNDSCWLNYNMLGLNIYENKEQAILSVIKNIHDNPEQYGSNKEEIKSELTYSDNKTAEEMVEKYSSIYNIPSEIVLSIMYSECGSNMNSHNYLSNNNPAGLGPHMHFENKEIGIIYFVNLLKEKYGCNINSTNEFFNKIASTYCSENKEHWLNMTNSHYNNITYQKVLIKNNI